MSINLQKGQRVDLTKGNAGLTRLMVGLGWDEAKRSKREVFLQAFLCFALLAIDCDASVLMLNENGKLSRKEDLIYFGNLQKHMRKCSAHRRQPYWRGRRG